MPFGALASSHFLLVSFLWPLPLGAWNNVGCLVMTFFFLLLRFPTPYMLAVFPHGYASLAFPLSGACTICRMPPAPAVCWGCIVDAFFDGPALSGQCCFLGLCCKWWLPPLCLFYLVLVLGNLPAPLGMYSPGCLLGLGNKCMGCYGDTSFGCCALSFWGFWWFLPLCY